MALAVINWRSEVLEKWTTMHVLVPEAVGPPYAVFYLLHGRSDDSSSWLRWTRLEVYARSYPLLIVMPDGYRGFYTNNHAGPAYAKHVGEEVVAFVERTFPVRRSRGARCIGGLSMGGYGALRVGLGYPQTFASITAHSGALMHGSRAPAGGEGEELWRVFGPAPAGTDHDLLYLARLAQRARRLPKIRLDCGSDDFLLADNREFHQRMRRAGIAHEYVEFAGAHNWDYWDQRIQEALAFHARQLKLEPLPAAG
jgi:S-formylglutathione hydrolase FrmB